MAMGIKRHNLYTIAKVLVVLLITLGALGLITHFTLRSHQQYREAVNALYQSDDGDLRLSEQILTGISRLDSRSRAYALTMQPEDLQAYVEGVEELRHDIDSLYLRSFGTTYHREVDSLRSLFQQKLTSFEQLMRLRMQYSERAQDRSALQALYHTRKVIRNDSMLVPRKQITTTTITSDDQAGEAEKSEYRDGGFFKRLFGGGKDKSQDPVKKEMHQERTVAYDSAYFEKVDTLFQAVQQALRRAETQRQVSSRQLTEQELQMVAFDQQIIGQLRSITQQVKNLEVEQLEAEKEEAIATARQSMSSVMMLAILGSIFSVLLIGFIIVDIVRSDSLQVRLAAAKAEAEHLARAKEEFLANMSHEIRTPLNAILGFSDQMAAGDLPRHQRQKLKNVRSSGEHLLMLVNDILDYSRIEAGKLRLEEIGFRVQTVVDESLATLEQIAENKGVELRQEIDEALNERILLGDPIRLKQILINLAGNGVKFTNCGFVKIVAEYLPGTGNDCRVRFSVEDTGKGIAPDKLEEIFESFGQEDTSIGRRYGGTGLGLTISRKLAELQGGRLFAHSELGEGSVFTVELPYKLTAQEHYTGQFDPARVDVNLRDKSLLLIDDDRLNHVLLKPSFERWGLEFESAYDGHSGLDKAARRHFDYILVDLQMPDLDGLKVIDQLRQEHVKPGQTQIILCTANAMIRQDRPDILDQVDATLLKPFKEYEIAALLGSPGEVEPHTAKANEILQPDYTLDNFRVYANQNPETLQIFIRSFITTNRKHLQQLRQAYAQGDYTDMGELAHKMKNTFGQLEAESVLLHLRELEKLSEGAMAKKVIEEHLQITEREAAQLFSALEEEIQSVSA